MGLLLHNATLGSLGCNNIYLPIITANIILPQNLVAKSNSSLKCYAKRSILYFKVITYSYAIRAAWHEY
jgi:hypothetical protein